METLTEFLHYWDNPACHRGIRARLLTDALRNRYRNAPHYALCAIVHDYLDQH